MIRAALGTKFGYQRPLRDTPRPTRDTAQSQDGAAQESNLPSRGLHDLTGFEDRLGHRARAAPLGRS
jgi:hypothetical protein